MWWRLSRSEFSQQCGEPRKADLNVLVDSGQMSGIPFYLNDEPIAWVSVARRFPSHPVMRYTVEQEH